MKLEVGMYVRTKGEITKIRWISMEFNEGEIIKEGRYHLENGQCLTIPKDEVKSSYNIIDLIEVGDYVNGYIVCEIDYARSGKYVMVDDNDKGWQSMYFNNQIKSIVTREQFEQCIYKIGDNNV